MQVLEAVSLARLFYLFCKNGDSLASFEREFVFSECTCLDL